jgi:hypothetical protein
MTTPRPYTGISDGIARARRPGLEQLVASIQYLTGGKLWNNGTYGIRTVRGSTRISVHATGRAADLSRRKMSTSRPGCSRAEALKIIQTLIDHFDGLECVVDYDYNGTARVWKCDRMAWRTATKGSISGSPGGDWFHIEISPKYADNPALIDQFWHDLLSGL